jgi:hypothetical protein
MRATDPTWIWRITMLAALPVIVIPLSRLLFANPPIEPWAVILATVGGLLIFARLYVGDNRVFQGELRMHAKNRVHICENLFSACLLIGQPLTLHLMARSIDNPAAFLLSQFVLLTFNVAWLGLRITRIFNFIRVHQGRPEFADDIHICLNMGQAMAIWIINNSVFLLTAALAFYWFEPGGRITNVLLVGSILSSAIDLCLTRRIYLGQTI